MAHGEYFHSWPPVPHGSKKLYVHKAKTAPGSCGLGNNRHRLLHLLYNPVYLPPLVCHTVPVSYYFLSSIRIMNFTQPLPSDAPHMICCSRIDKEKCAQHCNNYEHSTSLDDDTPYARHLHGNCHRQRLRRVLVPVLLGLLTAFLLLCVMSIARTMYFPEAGSGEEGWLVMLGDSFKHMKRATDGTTGNGNSFVNNKRTSFFHIL